MNSTLFPRPLVWVMALACSIDVPASTTLDTLLRAGDVVLTGVATGGHSGRVLVVEASNRRARPITVRIPAGWRFEPEDSTQQHLLLAEEQLMALAPGSSRRVRCRVFCCRASLKSPGTGSRYRRSGLAEERLVRVAEGLARDSFPDGAAQEAVWAVSDGRSLSAIDAKNAHRTDVLRRMVAGITGETIPWYTTRYDAPEEGVAMSTRAVEVFGAVEFQQRHAGLLSIVVKDVSGRTIHVIDDGRDLRQGRYTIAVSVAVKAWPPGRYALLFASDGVLLKRQEFVL